MLMDKVKLAFGTAVVFAVFCAMPAWAGEPSAIVEDLAAPDAGLELMDYVEDGRVIRLGSSGTITLGYLRSCWRETISGGTVTVGARRSTIKGGAVRREMVECDGGAIELSSAEAGKSGVMVFRRAPTAQEAGLPAPQLTLYGASPMITLIEPGGNVVIERLDKAGITIVIAVDGKFVDLAQGKSALEPGGLYRGRVGERAVVFKIDPFAQPGAGPIIGRLIRL